jgi:SAM-dependent methyltransferase
MTGAEKAFDSYAPEYDQHFSETTTGRLQRRRVWKFLSAFSSDKFPDVLELNCGTGEDALWLSKRGFRVTATDLSSGMVDVTGGKLRAAGAKDFGLVKVDAKLAPEFFKPRKFDLIFSDFGGMNCLSPDELKIFASSVKKIMNPEGRLMLVLMGRNCRWERYYFRKKGQVEKAERRKAGGPVTAEINGERFPVWYYSPAELQQIFSEEFTLICEKPVGLFLPPSYLDSWFAKRKGLLKILNFLERIFCFSIFSDDADHYYAEFILTHE